MNESAVRIQMANVPLRAGRQERWVLPDGTRWFTLQARGGTEFRCAVDNGRVITKDPPYFTIKANNSWDEKNLRVDYEHGLPLYFAADADDTVEILVGVADRTVKEDDDAS